MQPEIGKIYNGVVKGITKYGAFVDLEGGGTGMVHISEVSSTFVNDINDFLKENQEVKVKVIGITEAGKVSLSIKKASDNGEERPRGKRPYNNNNGNNNGGNGNNGEHRKSRPAPNYWEPPKKVPESELSFEDMLNRFKQNSEERMCDIKRSTDRKNGTRRK